jgi:hypothetical protein
LTGTSLDDRLVPHPFRQEKPMAGIQRSAYDALYDNDWDERPVVELYGDGTVLFEEFIQFAQFMSKGLGFRLKVTYTRGFYRVRFRKVD